MPPTFYFDEIKQKGIEKGILSIASSPSFRRLWVLVVGPDGRILNNAEVLRAGAYTLVRLWRKPLPVPPWGRKPRHS